MKRLKIFWEAIKEAIEWDTLNNWQKLGWVLVLLAILPPMVLEAKLNHQFPDMPHEN